MKKILHISSDFLYTELYNLLFESLSAGTNKQTVYSAVKINSSGLEFNSIKYTKVISPILNFTDKFFFRKRVLKVYSDIKSRLQMSEFDLVHAHFLFTDGAVALKLFQEHNIPYIVAIRNTDLNVYFKYFIHLRELAFKILLNSKKIILISPRYEDKILSFFSKDQANKLRGKMIVIPNGVDAFWIDNQIRKKNRPNFNKLNFLFVGEITNNKNLNQTISLLKKLSSYYSIQFTIIGKKLEGYEHLEKLLDKYSWIICLEPTRDKNLLKSHYRNADIFIMLSKTETFGLVYIESLSQGTPVLYTKGQGIDGYFAEGRVGYNFDIEKDSIIEFKQKVDSILNNYDKMSSDGVLESTKFTWSEISSKYISIYES